MQLTIRRLYSRQGAKHAKFRREKINYVEKMFIIIFRSLRPWRLCGRYSEFQLWLCGAKTPTMVIHRISYQHVRHYTSQVKKPIRRECRKTARSKIIGYSTPRLEGPEKVSGRA